MRRTNAWSLSAFGLALTAGAFVMLASPTPVAALPSAGLVVLAFKDKDDWKEHDKREAKREREYYKQESEREHESDKREAKRDRDYQKHLAKQERERAKVARERAKRRAELERERYGGEDWDEDFNRRDRYYDDDSPRVRVRTVPTGYDRDGDGYPNRRDRFPGDPRRH